ncbi:MAG: hypothetical protein ACTHNM_06680 [Dyella sp.]|uniref:hypothetical protein n=1 Tax=Dyella sp. TaxID=1869338 RepID=UPI003F813229
MPRSLRFLPRLTALLAAAMLMLAGCQRATEDSPAPGGDSPTAAARQLIDDLRHDDLVAFWQHGLPPAEHAALVARWASGQAAQVPTDAARQGYRQWMGSMTGPGARQALAQRLQQQARRIDRRYGDQIPVLIAIGGAMARRTVVTDLALTPRQEQGLAHLLAPVTAWAQRAPWLDGDRAGQTAAVAVETARSLRLANLADLRALDFADAMAKASRLWAGAKQALAPYGLSLDAVLDSATVTLVSQRADIAHVRIDYRLKDQPQHVVVKMQAVDGRWYPAALGQIARNLVPPDWGGWWEPTGVRPNRSATGRDMSPSSVQ